jgi:hypothetical protein
MYQISTAFLRLCRFLNASSQRNMNECTYKYLLFNLLSRVGPGLIHRFGEGGGGVNEWRDEWHE